MTKSLSQIVKNDDLGTEYETKNVFGEANFIHEALGEKVRFVGLKGVFEGSNGLLMTIQLWARDFDIEEYEDNDDE